MHRVETWLRRIGTPTGMLVVTLAGLPGFARAVAAQESMPSAAEEAEGAEVPHPFFTHMGDSPRAWASSISGPPDWRPAPKGRRTGISPFT